MFLEFPGPGGMLIALRAMAAAAVQPMRMMRTARHFLLPSLLLALGAGCSHHSNPNAPGTPPSLEVAPLDTTTVTGRTVTFTVTAVGAPQLRYQWDKNGVAIFGAVSSTFTILSPQPSDSGRYSVVISNPNSTITSYAALLTVVPALQFPAAVGIVADASGNLFLSDMVDHVIWKVDTSKNVSILAGTQGFPGSADTAPGVPAQFNSPGSLAFDPAGNLVVADTGNHTIRRVAMDGTVTTLAGSAGLSGSQDAKGSLARFNAPYGIAVDANGGIYIADTQNHTIRFMALDGTVSTYAGSAGLSGYQDGATGGAQFNQPNGLALANGSLYVADYGNSCIRVISSNAQVATLAGLASTPALLDGTGIAAQFNLPVGIACDASGNVWVADTHNYAVRSISPSGVVTTVAGTNTLGNADGTGAAALFDLPCGITFSASTGNVLVADTANHIVRVVTPAGVVTTM